MVGMEETLDIQALWRAGRSVSEIARVTGRHRRTIRPVLHIDISYQTYLRRTGGICAPESARGRSDLRPPEADVAVPVRRAALEPCRCR